MAHTRVHPDKDIGSIKIVADGRHDTMDIAPEIMNDRTMLPVRFVVEIIGCEKE